VAALQQSTNGWLASSDGYLLRYPSSRSFPGPPRWRYISKCECGSSSGGTHTDPFFSVQYFSWRSTFYFIAAFAGLTFVCFIFFPDSWRRERSHLYQAAIKRAINRVLVHQQHEEKKRARKLKKGLSSRDPTPGTTVPPTPRTGTHTPQQLEHGARTGKTDDMATPDRNNTGSAAKEAIFKLAEPPQKQSFLNRIGLNRQRSVQDGEEHVKIKLSITDVNPLPPMWAVLKKPNSLLAVFCSGAYERMCGELVETDCWLDCLGLLFAAQYTIAFTAAVTFAESVTSQSELQNPV
jgi:hypothetical protein